MFEEETEMAHLNVDEKIQLLNRENFEDEKATAEIEPFLNEGSLPRLNNQAKLWSINCRTCVLQLLQCIKMTKQ